MTECPESFAHQMAEAGEALRSFGAAFWNVLPFVPKWGPVDSRNHEQGRKRTER